jgi:biopolymer transport protein ExbD
MRFLPLILPLCLIASCEKHTPVSSRVPIGIRFGDLPVSSYFEKLTATDSGYIEAIIDGDLAEIHHPNGHLDSTAAGQSFEKVVEGISRSVSNQQPVPPLLISATASTKFNRIRPLIRSAAAAGIYRVLLLVNSDTEGTGIIRIELPNTGEATPKFEPFFVQIDDEGKIFTGTGASRTRMDNGADDRNLEILNSQLELFSAAAKSAGYRIVPCQIYVNPEASYQRMIDLLAAVTKRGLRPYLTDMEPEPLPKMERFQRKPSPPGSSLEKVKPLGLAPK